MKSGQLFLGLTLLFAAGLAYGDDVNHYEIAPSVLRAGGQQIYPSGVSDPAMQNPPGPPPEAAIPAPPVALPGSATPPAAPVWSPSGPASASNSVQGATVAGPMLYPPAQGQVYPSAAMPTYTAPVAAPAIQLEKTLPASWYTRVEYFHWNERTGGQDFVNEVGTLVTVGYERQIGIERFRAEMFGGDVHYDGYDQSGSTLIPLTSNTGYLGVRGEYELVLAPAAWEGRLAFMAGVGTRFWVRDLHDGTDSQGNAVWGYQESWWTTYPFLGMETHRRLSDELELYSESRVGSTLLTYQFASINERPLWPKPGLMVNAEIGLRGSRFFIAARAEVMSWAESSVVQDSFQPNSLMVTAGGRLGFMF